MTEFLEFLGLPRDADEEAATIALTALLTSAVRDEKPSVSLEEIHHKVATLNGSQYIDALHALPLLLEHPDPKARDLVGIIGECSSAKEALIAAQEYLERLTRDFQRDSNDEDDEEQEKRPRVDALVTTIDLYTSGP
ncbi:hypothetical protein EST38_g6457 [Candolleomyces aberdarensis]|uniref:Uncharacterized protein n=1 Tax=Candolleomyces aberdarensis TaxID=2316362 RepID=A0A4V1Q3Q3_9AGAR|nr:hypothetical protein EST38_g6457 [Candolleomyces aberdarensis]